MKDGVGLVPLRAADMRRRNRALILDQLRDGQRWSRANLAEATTLTTEGVRELLGDLVGEGLVNEMRTTAAAPRRGRPPAFYEFNVASGVAIGVSLGPRQITTVLTDAAGSEVGRRQTGVGSLRPEAVIEQTATMIETLVRETGGGLAADIRGICVSVHGDVDSSVGVVHTSPGMEWENIALAELLGARLGHPVQCIDGASANTIAEHREGVARGRRDVVVLDLGTWVAAGVIIDGKRHAGVTGLAGQLRSCPVPDGDGFLTLGEAASGRRVVGAYRTGEDGAAIGWADVVRAARSGDVGARRAIQSAGGAVVHAATWLIGCYGPELLVLGGVFGDLEPADANQVITDIYASCGPRARAQIEIVRSALGREAWIRGAVHVALDAVSEQLIGQNSTARAN